MKFALSSKRAARKLLAAICASTFFFTLLPDGGVAEASVYSQVQAAKRAERVRAHAAKKIEKEKTAKPEKAAQTKGGKPTAGTARKPAKGTKPEKPASGTTAKKKIVAKETAPFFPAKKVDSLISTANKLKGTPYVYGGTTPKGFDCSGFLQYVFKKNGANIPRTADAQFDIGRRVEKQNALVKGDLVFFTDGREISHCGLYIGGGKFIHASSSKGVRVDALNDYYWKPRYAGGKHVLKN